MPRPFFASFRSRTSQYPQVQAELGFAPQSWSWTAVGGYDQAEISVRGAAESLHEILNLIGWQATVRNEHGSIVWEGHVHEVELSLGGIAVTLSLEEVYNRVAVTYVTYAADGSATQGQTSWLDDTKSQDVYGVKELLVSFEGTVTDAERLRSKTLVEKRHPLPQVRSERGEVGATLYCLGPWHRLGWQYYQQLQGLEENPGGGAGDQQLGGSYSATTIRFASQDDLYDSAGLTADGLDALAVGDSFSVAGASNAANNTTPDALFTVKSKELAGSDGHIETVDKDRVDEAAGNSITLSRGTGRVDRVAQSITLTENVDDWTVAAVSVRVQAVGSPSDNLVCELRSDSGGNPGTLLDSASLAGSAIPTEMSWVEFTLSNTDALTYGTTYWIVLRRSGSNSLANYYVVDVNEDEPYAGGQVKVYNGSSYAVRSPAADMPFRVTGKVETTTQIEEMIESNAEFGSGSVTVRNASGIDTWQYREGDALALDEIEKLLEQGTSAEERLLAQVFVEANGDPDRRVVISKQPSAGQADLRLNADGSLSQTVGGATAPMEPGVNVAGQWVIVNVERLRDVLATAALFVERAEYVVSEDLTYIESEVSRRVWNLGRARQG
jgi:hypothetical protein